MTQTVAPAAAPRGWIARSLDLIERVGNKLPDPVVLFLLLMVAAWLVSWWLSGVSFTEIDPRTGQPLQVNNQLAGAALTSFMSKMVGTFTSFPPLGVVLVAMLGLGVAEHTGFISAVLRAAMSVTPRVLLTPALVAVGILSHVAVDAGYVLVIPLGAVIFYAAGRHPLAGIAAAFAGVSGGFSATLGVPSSLDPLLSGLSQTAAQLVDPSVVVNPLNNFVFTTVSSALIIVVGWVLTDLVIEPRLRATRVDGGPCRAADAGAARAARATRAAVGRARGRARGGCAAADAAARGYALGRAAGRGRATRAAGLGRTVDAVDRAHHLRHVPDPGHRVRRGLGQREDPPRRRRRHGEVDVGHGLLHRHGFLLRAVHLRVRAVEPRRVARHQGCQRAARAWRCRSA